MKRECILCKKEYAKKGEYFCQACFDDADILDKIRAWWLKQLHKGSHGRVKNPKKRFTHYSKFMRRFDKHGEEK